MKTIILPTDGSENAERAMRYALALYTGQAARFIVFQSIDISAYGADIPVSPELIGVEVHEQELTRQLTKWTADYAHEPFTFEAKVMLGGLAACLDELADDVNAALVVMGTKGATGLLGTVLGSNASDVISNASCPVIIVPEQAEIRIPKTILFAMDNKGLSSPQLAAPMLEIARKSGASVHLLHVLDAGVTITVEEAIAGLQMENLMDGIAHDYLFLSNEDKALAIEQHVLGNAIDLLVTVPRRNNFFDAIFHRSVTRKLALHTAVPMLVMHDLG